MNINSGYIKQVVSDYLFEKGKDKVTGDDVEDMGKCEEEHLEHKGVEFLRIATAFERPGEVTQC